MPAQTTMRAQLGALAELGVIERRREAPFPGALNFELTGTGQGLAKVMEAVGHWLAAAPRAALPLGSPAAKNAIKAFVEGWETKVIRALAAQPLSLTQLDNLIAGVSYPSLERRLAAMRLAGQIAKAPDAGKGVPYVVTDWLRYAVGPLAASMRWERVNASHKTNPAGRLDVQAAFLLAIPAVGLHPDLGGSCRLAVDVQGLAGEPAGVIAHVGEGQVISCSTKLRGETNASASGSIPAWLDALVDGEVDRLEIGGDWRLADALISGLHRALFYLRQPR